MLLARISDRLARATRATKSLKDTRLRRRLVNRASQDANTPKSHNRKQQDICLPIRYRPHFNAR